MRKEELYRQIKISGMVFFIPLMLAVGPIGGFFIGEYLEKKFGFPRYAVLICITLGFAAGVFETVRIIKLVTRIDKKDK